MHYTLRNFESSHNLKLQNPLCAYNNTWTSTTFISSFSSDAMFPTTRRLLTEHRSAENSIFITGTVKGTMAAC